MYNRDKNIDIPKVNIGAAPTPWSICPSINQHLWYANEACKSSSDALVCCVPLLHRFLSASPPV